MQSRVEKRLMMGVSRFVFFVLFFSLLAVGSLSCVSAANHSVVGNSFADIQSVVDNDAVSGDSIILDNITYIGSGSHIRVNKSITIQGESSDKYATLDARDLSRVFFIPSDVSLVTFKYIAFVNGNSINQVGGGVAGGAIRSYSNLHISDCVFKNNLGGSGGAVFLINSTGSIVANTIFMNNHADLDDEDDYTEGGGLDIHGSNTQVINCTFINNSATSSGGALSFVLGIGNHVINCSFINNSAPLGGAIRFSSITVVLEGCNLTNNSADEIGGGIFIQNSIADLKNAIFINNTAPLGGAIYASSNNDIVTITNSYFNINYANNGGALYILCDLELTSSNFTSNRAGTGNTSGAYSTSAILIQNNNFRNNIGIALTLIGQGTRIIGNNFTSNTGHGIRSSNLNNAVINNNRFVNNGGNGLDISGNGNRIYNNIFTGNNIGVIVNGNNLNFTNNLVSGSRGDGLRLTGNNLIFVSNNISSNGGHGLVFNGNNLTITNCIFIGNNYGINSQSLTNGLINNNVFSNNRGTGFYAKGSNNKIHGNNFTANSVGVNAIGDNINFRNNNVLNNLLYGVIFVGNSVYIGYNNFTGNKRNSVNVKGHYTLIERNFFSGNSIDKNSNYIVIVEGNYAKISFNTMKNNGFHGIYLIGNNFELRYNNISYSKGNGIYILGNYGDFSYNNVNNNDLVGIILRGNSNKVYKNNITLNKGHGVSFVGSGSNITHNIFNRNSKNGLRVEGNKNTISDNEIRNNTGKGLEIIGNSHRIEYNILSSNLNNGVYAKGNSHLVRGNLVFGNSYKKNQKSSAMYFIGDSNNFHYNIIQNNGYHGLYIKGHKNVVYRNPIFSNKHTQLISHGNKNKLSYSNIEGGSKSGLRVIGNSNKLSNIQVNANKAHGIIIKGNKNQILKVASNGNRVGVHFSGQKNILEQSVIASNKKYGIYHLKGSNNRYNYNYIVNNKAKANLHRVKGSVNADFNWWGKNNLKTVKNLKVKKFVVAKLNSPNILKVGKIHKINVKFSANDNKKLKKRIPSLIVAFGFKGGKVKPNVVPAPKHIAKTKIKHNSYKSINLVAQVDNQILYRQHVTYNGKLYEYKLYKRIIVEKIRKYNSWVKRQNEEAKKRNQLAVGTYMVFSASYGSYLYSRSNMGRDLAKSTSIIIKSPKIYLPAHFKAGVGYAPSGLNWLDGMKARNMPVGSVTKGLYDIAVKNNITDSRIYYVLYIAGKISDALVYSNGDVNKFFEYNFLNIYGYSNFDNYGWGGQAGKAILEFTLGIDEKGNMGLGDFALNLLSIAFGFGVGGLAVKGGKSLTQSILKKLPAGMRVTATPVVKTFVDQIGKFTNKIPKGFMEASKIRENIVDVAKILTGDFSPISKVVSKNSKDLELIFTSFKNTYSGLDNFLKFAKGDLKGALNILYTNFSTMSSLLKDKKFYSYLDGLMSTSKAKSDLSTIVKSINEGPDNIKKILDALNTPGSSAESTAKNDINEYMELMKKFEKLLKSQGLK